jgi:hydrogenase/urease accessory protein HupE
MSTRLVPSSLWIVAGVLGIGTSLVFRVEPLSWAITIALGILAVLVGTVPLLRAEPRVAPWSVALGIAWVSCYVALAVWQLDDPAALITDVGLALIGAAAAVVGRRPAIAAA